MTDVNFILTPTLVDEVCLHPDLAIPDNNPTGVSSNMTVAMNGATVSSMEVYVGITHTYQGDLIVKVISPSGRTVTLHNRTGGTTDNIIGYYPSQLTPTESLDGMIGEATDGQWRLTVSDNAGVDVGTLNDWCVKITHGGLNPADAPDGTLPKSLVLGDSRPNPVNGQAAIRYDLPRTGQVDLSIFDVTGRKVATLVSGIVPAGRHEAIWHGRDDAGREVASGLYWYRLTAGGNALNRKLLVIR